MSMYKLNILFVDLSRFHTFTLTPTLSYDDLESELAKEMGILKWDITNIFVVNISLPEDESVESVHAAFDQSTAEPKLLKRRQSLQEVCPNPSPDMLHLVVRTCTNVNTSNITIFHLNTREFQYPKAELVNITRQKVQSLLPGSNVQFYQPSHPIFFHDEKSRKDALASIDRGALTKIPAEQPLRDVYPRGYGPNRLHFVIVDSTSESAPEEDDAGELPNLRRRLKFLNSNPSKAPSSEALLPNFAANQRREKSAILCGRPLHREARIPASLLNEILSKFRHNLNTITPSAEDMVAFQELRSELTGTFDLESQRRDKLISILNKHHIGPQDQVIWPSPINDYYTDGVLRKAVDGLVFHYYLQEIKNEIGTGGGDPYYEAVRYYLEQIRLLLKSSELTEDQVEHLNFPAILLIHFGAYISVAAAVFTVHPVVEHLTCIPLAVHSTNEVELAAGERMIASLRNALIDLRAYYSSVHSFDKSCAPFEYPFRTFYEIREGEETSRCFFTYEAIIEDKRIFRARTQDNQTVVIKFSQRYCEAAHRTAYDLDLAPKLITVNQFYGWFMVVMDDVSADYTTAWDIRNSLSPDDKQSIQNKTSAALARVNVEGFVHGDVRHVNVLIRQAEANSKLPELLIVDWDWAGKQGEVLYPRNMNPRIWRPVGAGAGAPILAAHDVEMALNLFTYDDYDD